MIMIMKDMMMEGDDDDHLNDLNLTAIFSSLLTGLCLVKASLISLFKAHHKFIIDTDPIIINIVYIVINIWPVRTQAKAPL